jgi:hypothetical protein
MAAEWEKLREKVVGLQAEIARFEVDFLDRDGFPFDTIHVLPFTIPINSSVQL